MTHEVDCGLTVARHSILFPRKNINPPAAKTARAPNKNPPEDPTSNHSIGVPPVMELVIFEACGSLGEPALLPPQIWEPEGKLSSIIGTYCKQKG